MNLEIRKLSQNDGKEFYDMLQEMPADENGFINSVAGIGSTGRIAAVSDRDAIIALSGAPKRELLDKPNSEELGRLMEQRRNYRYEAGEPRVSPADGTDKYHLGVATPILSQGDLMGCVMLLLSEGDQPLNEQDQKLAQTAASFLGKQMEN